MTTNFPRESATIYQFPARGRYAAAGHRDQTESAMTMSARAAKISFGAWYHEAAIQEAEQGRKN
jgi:Protein of unknown function (DUF2735)